MDSQRRTSGIRRLLGDGEIAKGIAVGLVGAVIFLCAVRIMSPRFDWLQRIEQPLHAVTAAVQQHILSRSADLDGRDASPDVRRLADWVALSGDAQGMDFLIVDKRDAALYVFDPSAHLSASSRILIGAAVGDDTVPGIGARPIADVLPEERTTPAGRFVAESGHDTRGEDVIWVDYDAGVSMHRVITTNPQERRLERLATPFTDDKRISYGCINVPIAFYDGVVKPLFAGRRAVVYVLPEVKPLEEVFALNTRTASDFSVVPAKAGTQLR